MSRNRPPRLTDFTYIGLYRYHVRICTWHRARYFTDRATATMARDRLPLSATEHGFAIPAYCVMPDHVHLLAEAERATANLTAFVARWKQDTGFRFRSNTGHRLWQPGFFDRVLREDESNRVVARYILENPVRAGLAEAPDEYQYAYCAWAADPGFWD